MDQDTVMLTVQMTSNTAPVGKLTKERFAMKGGKQ